MSITKGQINKILGRKGIRIAFVENFLSNLSGNKQQDLDNLLTHKYNANTINACKAGITIAYSGDDNNGRKPSSKVV